MSNTLFTTLNWNDIPKFEYKAGKGTSFSQTMQFEGLRIRIVEYGVGYFADHWCQKGHIVHCLDGEFVLQLSTGEKITLSQGMSFVVSDDLSSHLIVSDNGARVLIIDVDFLK